jgi:DNA end-binding protein Ku
VRDGVFVLETMLWPDEVRSPDFGFLDEDVEVRPQELAMAGSLIETLSGEFDASQYKDEYREALQAVIEAKVEGREVVQPTESQPTSGTVVDLMAALRASVEAAKKGGAAPAQAAGRGARRRRPARSAGEGARARRRPPKKAPAKKAPGQGRTARQARAQVAEDSPPSAGAQVGTPLSVAVPTADRGGRRLASTR